MAGFNYALGRQQLARPASAALPAIGRDQQFGVQPDFVIDRQILARFLDAVGQMVLLAEEDVGIVGDGGVHLDVNVLIEDQADDAFVVGDGVLDQLVAELAGGRDRRKHYRDGVGAQDIGFEQADIHRAAAELVVIEAAAVAKRI